MKEPNGYRQELEQLLEFTNQRHRISVLDLAEYDYGKAKTKKEAYRNSDKVRKIYKLPKGIREVPIGEIARRRCYGI